METDFVDISVVIITLNGERTLAKCLQSLPKGVETVILDSGSTDKTLEIAKSFGAKVFSLPFSNYSQQKNAAIQLATRNWILSLDCDEVLNEELRAVLTDLSHSQENRAYMIRRKLVFMDKLLNYGGASDWQLRLFRRGEGIFEGEIHERLVVTARSRDRLQEGEIHHYSYDDLADYFTKFNRYTSLVAREKRAGLSPLKFAGHVLRPWWEFLRRYVFLLGMLDGYPGYVYALISSLYSFIKYAKYYEKENLAQQSHLARPL
jgi:glycosyltransferase involved in cell wall biosynthesis